MEKMSIEIVDTPLLRELGLQYRKNLQGGMLFKFDRNNVLNFWMKNTYLPLDIAFMDDDGTVVNTERMIPLSLSTVSSSSPCKLALEVPAGTFDRLGVCPGSKIHIDWDNKVIGFNDCNSA
jgi:uncharacterized membrane protein (UPF0127 family)